MSFVTITISLSESDTSNNFLIEGISNAINQLGYYKLCKVHQNVSDVEGGFYKTTQLQIPLVFMHETQNHVSDYVQLRKCIDTVDIDLMATISNRGNGDVDIDIFVSSDIRRIRINDRTLWYDDTSTIVNTIVALFITHGVINIKHDLNEVLKHVDASEIEQRQSTVATAYEEPETKKLKKFFEFNLIDPNKYSDNYLTSQIHDIIHEVFDQLNIPIHIATYLDSNGIYQYIFIKYDISPLEGKSSVTWHDASLGKMNGTEVIITGGDIKMSVSTEQEDDESEYKPIVSIWAEEGTVFAFEFHEGVEVIKRIYDRLV